MGIRYTCTLCGLVIKEDDIVQVILRGHHNERVSKCCANCAQKISDFLDNAGKLTDAEEVKK